MKKRKEIEEREGGLSARDSAPFESMSVRISTLYKVKRWKCMKTMCFRVA